MPKNNDLAVIFGEFLQRIGQQNGLFAAGCLMAGRTTPVDQAPVQQARGLIQADRQFSFQADIPALCPQVAAQEVRKIGRHDLPQPTDELGFARSLKSGKIAVGFQERVLHKVRGIEFRLKVSPDLDPRQQTEIMPVDLQQLAELLAAAGASLMKQFVWRGCGAHKITLIRHFQFRGIGIPGDGNAILPRKGRPVISCHLAFCSAFKIVTYRLLVLAGQSPDFLHLFLS